MRRAKIVCTIGPATESPEKLRELVDAGMNVARINRSHGEQEAHAAVYRNVREAAKAAGKSVAVLVDLQGPKIRLGRFAGDEKHFLNKGDTFTITTEDILGDREIVSTTHKGLAQDAQVLIMDEPTSGVDVRTRHEVVHLLADLNDALKSPQPAIELLTMAAAGITHALEAAYLPGRSATPDSIGAMRALVSTSQRSLEYFASLDGDKPAPPAGLG